MGSQLVYNKPAILEMDKNPAYKDPGETWGKNQISMVMWDYLEEGSAILDDAAWASQVLEGDKYVTASLVVPMAYRLMATSSSQHPVKFANRVEDEFNDDDVNPPKVPHDQLTDKIQTAREGLHEQLVDRFDTNVARDIKQFWFIATMCDPRFKKYDAHAGCHVVHSRVQHEIQGKGCSADRCAGCLARRRLWHSGTAPCEAAQDKCRWLLCRFR
jgi:hypothetical protein